MEWAELVLIRLGACRLTRRDIPPSNFLSPLPSPDSQDRNTPPPTSDRRETEARTTEEAGSGMVPLLIWGGRVWGLSDPGSPCLPRPPVLPRLQAPGAGSPIPARGLPPLPRPPARPGTGIPGTRSPAAARSSASPSPIVAAGTWGVFSSYDGMPILNGSLLSEVRTLVYV